MEGGDVEYWRIYEQCGLGLQEEDEDEKGIVSKTRWGVLKTGLRLGKKVVISGIVVSSAPLVLPPLITICVLGFVVLVPAGFFLASYACTEKLMSKLLPIPPAPPLLLEYQYSQVLRNGNEVEEFEEELYGRDSEGELAMKMEEEERIELVRVNEEGCAQYVEKHDDDDKKGIGIDDDENLEEEVYEEKEDIIFEYNNIDGENMKEKGYEEEDMDGGEYLEVEHEVKEEIIVDEDLKEEGYEEEDTKDINMDENLEKGYEEDVGEYLEGELHVSIDENSEEGYEEATGEYLEEEHEVEKDNIDDENLEKGYEEDDDGEYLEGEHQENKEINIDENSDEVYEEAVGESFEGEHEEDEKDENLEKGYEEEEEDAGEYLEEGEDDDVKKLEISIDEKLEEDYYEEAIGEYLEAEHIDEEKDSNIDENLEKGGYEEDDLGEEYLVGELHKDKNEISIDDEDLDEGYEEDVGEYLEEEEEHDEGPMPDQMNMETEPGKEELLHSEFGENVKRTEELDLVATSASGTGNYNNEAAEENFEHKSVTLLGNVGSSVKEDEGHLENPSGFEEEEEEDKKDTRISSKVDENPFIGTEANVEITVAMVKETELEPETDKQGNAAELQVSPGLPPPQHNEINSNEAAGPPSSEVMVSEEKIWEQISAIRGILGYTAAPESSTVDELKALFILTGVEPPSPFEDPSDLTDVDEKLRLLMSIVGAK